MMSHQKKGIHPRPCGIINLSNIISYGRGTLPYLIDEDEEDDMEIVSFTDRDILNKVNKNGYYTLNESVEELKN